MLRSRPRGFPVLAILVGIALAGCSDDDPPGSASPSAGDQACVNRWNDFAADHPGAAVVGVAEVFANHQQFELLEVAIRRVADSRPPVPADSCVLALRDPRSKSERVFSQRGPDADWDLADRVPVAAAGPPDPLILLRNGRLRWDRSRP